VNQSSSIEPALAVTLIESNPDAVIFAGTDGMITFWNEAAQRIFGFAATEAVGQSLDIIVPEQFRDAHWTGYDRALAAGETKYAGQALTTRAMKNDGEVIYVELAFAMIHDAAGAMAGVMATAREITERFNADRAMRRELRELKAAAKG
jgi:PAS domain S-box-containing protein